MMLTDFKSGYLLLPYDVENSLIELPKDVKTHLFESNVGEINEKEIITELILHLITIFYFFKIIFFII